MALGNDSAIAQNEGLGDETPAQETASQTATPNAEATQVLLDVDNDEDDDDESGSDDSDDAEEPTNTPYVYVPQNCNFGERYPMLSGDDKSPFPHPYTTDAWGDVYTTPVCLEEQGVNGASEAIRQKPEWWQKIDDETIVAKWKTEMVEQGVREPWADYVIKELKEVYRPISAKFEHKAGPILTREIMQGDGLVSEDTKTKLKTVVKELLEDEGEPDWHPGSNEQVLDLVHPSLFPIVYEKTRVLQSDQPDLKFELGTTEGLFPSLDKCIKAPVYDCKTDANKNDIADYAISKKYQWIPTPFKIDENGKVSVQSYINNLHPIWHKDLYPLIGQIFEDCVPALEHTLGAFLSGQLRRINPMSHSNGYYSDEEPNFEDENGEWDDTLWEEWNENRVPAINNPPEEVVQMTKEFEAKGKTLNVITKLANIHLTPENPSYPGGTWHVEGTINENIVATVLYYYDVENISESRLAFRTAISDPEYEQSDERGVRMVFGIEDEQKMVMELGNVEAKEGRVVVFPNIYQHQVQPFELADKTKPGHRKIVCFFICDPHDKKVHTTARVPPQNSAWWGEKVRSIGLLDKLPDELFNKVLDAHDDYPWSLQAAKEVRLDLMEERGKVVEDQNEEEFDGPLFGRQFSLCEH
ncbi:YALIA101S04e12662g1_1 [Yarrowia lipolytica]|nr:YALIA101S04e12662g1_1 [Yarrowia lipolytica]